MPACAAGSRQQDRRSVYPYSLTKICPASSSSSTGVAVIWRNVLPLRNQREDTRGIGRLHNRAPRAVQPEPPTELCHAVRRLAAGLQEVFHRRPRRFLGRRSTERDTSSPLPAMAAMHCAAATEHSMRPPPANIGRLVVRCGAVVSVATVGQANAVDAATAIARMILGEGLSRLTPCGEVRFSARAGPVLPVRRRGGGRPCRRAPRTPRGGRR